MGVVWQSVNTCVCICSACVCASGWVWVGVAHCKSTCLKLFMGSSSYTLKYARTVMLHHHCIFFSIIASPVVCSCVCPQVTVGELLLLPILYKYLFLYLPHYLVFSMFYCLLKEFFFFLPFFCNIFFLNLCGSVKALTVNNCVDLQSLSCSLCCVPLTGQ